MSKVFKYNELAILEDIKKYIESTYGQHYVNGDSGMQIQDLFNSIGIVSEFCQANAIKYIARYGKKDGKNKKDLLKAIHYAILLMYFDEHVECSDENQGMNSELLCERFFTGRELNK